jgi:hypothetical protein
MMILRPLFVLGLALTLATSTAEAAKGKKKKEHAHRGVVEAVNLDKDKDSGTITIKAHGKKKKKGAEAAAAKDETFKLTAKTKVERIAGKKGNKTTEAGKLSELKPGEQVIVESKEGVAEEIKIVAKKKGKKKKNQNT